MADIDDWPRAQALADSLSPERLHRALDRYAEQRCPVSNAFAHCVDSTTSSASLAPRPRLRRGERFRCGLPHIHLRTKPGSGCWLGLGRAPPHHPLAG